MKIIHINSYDTGGAAASAIRLHNEFLNYGIDSKFLFLFRFTNKKIYNSYTYHDLCSRSVHFISLLLSFSNNILFDDSVIKNYQSSFEKLSYPATNFSVERLDLIESADVIILHWIADFINYPSFFKTIKGKIIIWRLADMNPFLGILHYNLYKSIDEYNLVKNFDERALYIKKKSINYALSNNRFLINGMTNWMNQEAIDSKIFEGANFFKVFSGLRFSSPKESKLEAKKMLGLPTNRPILLFSSESLSNWRKGFDILHDILGDIFTASNSLLMTIGKTPTDLNIYSSDIIFLGEIHDDVLLRLYFRASDIYLFPSRMDNLSNTILEALSQETLTVAFDTGGNSEFLVDGYNSILSKDVSAKSFLDAVFRGLSCIDQLSTNQFLDTSVASCSIVEKYLNAITDYDN